MDASTIFEMKALAEENRRLKRMYAEMSMQNDLLKDILGKKVARGHLEGRSLSVIACNHREGTSWQINWPTGV